MKTMSNKPIFSRHTVKYDDAGWTKDQLDRVVYPEIEAVTDINQQTDSLNPISGFDLDQQSSLDQMKAKFLNLSKYEIGIRAEDLRVDRVNTEAHPTLFLDFADLLLRRPIEVKKFVHQFGLLFPPNILDSISPDTKNGEIITEPLAAWIYFQLELKNLIHIWRSFANRTKKTSLILFDEVDGRMTDCRFSDKFSYSKYPAIDQIRPLQMVKPDNIDEYSFVAESFEKRLARLRSLTQPNYKIGDLKRKNTTLLGSSGSFVHYDTFLGAALHQLIDAIENDKTYTRCLECGKWMEASNKGKLYDTASCKASAGRRRRELSLLFEVKENFGELVAKTLKRFFQIQFRNEGQPFDRMEEFFLEMDVGEQLRKRLRDVFLNTEDCLSNGARFDLIVDHIGLGKEASELMKSLQHDLYIHILPEFQTAYYDWSWGVQAFEKDPMKQGIGSLLLD